jgi:hypothetical protein
MHFEPLPGDELQVCKPPSNDEWLQYLMIMRIAYRMLGRTKDEMKTVVKAMEEANENPQVFDQFEATISVLKGYVGMLECAEARFLSAAASVAEGEKLEEART